MSGDVTPYTSLITSEHADKPNFMAMVAASFQPFADAIAVMNGVAGLYDLDVAVGQQLDVVGEWVGRTREISEPLRIYFSFDMDGLGFDQGFWYNPFNPTTGAIALPDAEYRILLYSAILNNNWNGSIEQAYALADMIFAPLGYTWFIEDYCDMTMAIGLIGPVPNALTIALLASGELDLRPAGVSIYGYYFPQQTGPMFAFDLNTTHFAGFDDGAWAGIA